jgi:fructokinase
MTGTSDYDKGVKLLKDKYGIKIVFATMGKDGSRAYYKDIIAYGKPFSVNTIETTGAGDTFGGCALNYILEHGIDSLTEQDLTRLLTFANAGAALVTTRKGALGVMPDKSEIEKLISG